MLIFTIQIYTIGNNIVVMGAFDHLIQHYPGNWSRNGRVKISFRVRKLTSKHLTHSQIKLWYRKKAELKRKKRKGSRRVAQ